MRDMMINAMKSYYIGLVNKHLVNIENMLTRSVGIGEPEHQDVFSALDVEMEKLANCNDKLMMVGKYLERSLENEKPKMEEKPKSK
tara:strand:- start:138 stop:395 length:258 start_codon:yes stop_codon:yes gene_type:complete